MATGSGRTLTVTFLGNTAGLEQAFKKVGTQVGGLEAASKRLNSVGKSLTRNVTLPVIGIGIAAGKMASDFQAAMERLHTQAGVSQAAVAALSKGVLALAGKVGVAPTVLADGMYHVASSLNATLAPAHRAAIELKVLKIAAEGARVGNANLVDVTNALDAAIVSGIKGVSNYSQAMGALNAIVGAGDMTMQDLADALSTGLLAPMKTYGLTLKDVGGALAVFGDNNIRGQDAATKLISAVRIMAAPSKAAAKELKTIGLSSLQLANDMRTGGLIKALADLKQHLADSGDTAAQQGLVIARSFGGRQSTGVQILINQLERLRAKTSDVGKGAQGFASAWSATQQTAAQKTAAAVAMIKADLIRFGNDVLPTLLKIGGTVVKDIDKVARAFASLPSGLKGTIIKGGLILAAVGPALRILGIFTGGVGKLLDAAKLAARLAATGSFKAGVPAAAASAARTSAVSTGVQGVETAGTASLAARAGSVALRGAGVAGLALLAAPFALALGKAVSTWINSDATKLGQKFADKFVAPLPKTIQDKFRKPLADVAKNAVNATPVKTPNFAHTGTKAETPAQFKAEFDAFYKQGFTAGKAFTAGFGAVRIKTIPAFLSDASLELSKLPAKARNEAASVMVTYAQSLEKNGQLPKHATDAIIASLETKYRGLAPFLASQGRDSSATIAATMKWDGAVKNLVKSEQKIRTIYGLWRVDPNINGANVVHVFGVEMSRLKDIAASQTGKAKEATLAKIRSLRSQANGVLRGMVGDFTTKQGQMADILAHGKGSHKWNTAIAQSLKNFEAFVSGIGTLMSAGVTSVQRGADAIYKAMLAISKSLHGNPTKVAQGTFKVSSSLLAGVENLVGKVATGHARGGLVQFGRAGQRGRDSIPVNFGGVPIKVGPGEVGAVMTGDQQAFLNARTADVGGLPGVFSKLNRPHHMATGGMSGKANLMPGSSTPGFATGGLLSVPSQSNAIQILEAQLANQLLVAQNKGIDPQRILDKQLALQHRELALDQSTLAAINAALAGHLAAARRAKLIAGKLTILQEIGNVLSNIGSTSSSLTGLAGGGLGAFDLAPGNIKLPTPYDVLHARHRRHHPGHDRPELAPGPGVHDPFAHHVTNNIAIHAAVHVDAKHNADDIVSKVHDELEREIVGPLKARLRASGLRGS